MNNMSCFSCDLYLPNICPGAKDGISGDCELYSYAWRRVRADIIMNLMEQEDNAQEGEEAKVPWLYDWVWKDEFTGLTDEEFNQYMECTWRTKERWDIICRSMQEEEMHLEEIYLLFLEGAGQKWADKWKEIYQSAQE